MAYAEQFSRTALVAGDMMMDMMRDSRVILFGVGGVGSWCAEALTRSGIGHLTIVDSDNIDITNINRQLMATTSTVGRPKVEVLGNRLTDINPVLDLQTVIGIYDRTTADCYNLGDYDYIIDAIDSLDCKAQLILKATAETSATLFSSMGAALKLSADKIATNEFRKVEGCPLARALRQKFKREGIMPARKFMCVYSPERIPNRLHAVVPQESTDSDRWSSKKAVINGTFAHTTATFGFTLAGLVIEDFYRKSEHKDQ